MKKGVSHLCHFYPDMMSYCQSFDDVLQWKERAAHLQLSDVADFGILAVQNTVQNRCVPYKNGLALKDKFLNIPVLIVGAGPSLEKEAHLIEKFNGLIFAGGAALNVLTLEPHFAAGIDKTEFKPHSY